MSCVLRVGGEGFPAVEFLRGSGLRPYAVESDSFKITVSESDELPDQIAEAIEFLKANFAVLEKLPRLEESPDLLDFSQFVPSFYDFPGQFLRWPAELLFLAGSLGLDIELSQYAVSEEKTDADNQL